MIDVNNIINYNRTDAELEELILFLICVAGKNANTTARQLDTMLQNDGNHSPFQVIRAIVGLGQDVLISDLKYLGFGCQKRLARAFTELVNSDIDLRTCTKEDLMQVHGIGRKSASCFMAWTREGARVAMLDVHILKYLTEQQRRFTKKTGNLWIPDKCWYWWEKLEPLKIPKSTPSGKLYDKLEEIYLDICDSLNVNPVEHDLAIWRSYARHG